MTSYDDQTHEHGSSQDTADGPEGAGGDGGVNVDMGTAKQERAYQPGEDDLTEFETAADSQEPASQDTLTESGAIRGEIVMAAVTGETPGQSDEGRADELAGAGSAQGATTVGAADGPTHDTGLGQEWRDIQAAFVDDPAGAVQLAADATSAALSTLIDSLRRAQSVLMNDGSSSRAPDTEQLRAALRDYRTLCENVDQIGRRFAQPM
jgi:hypothetical protein